MKVSQRGRIPPFQIMEVFAEANELAAQGEDIIHLSLGQPSRPSPKAVLEEASRLVGIERLGYTEAPGNKPLRERLVQFYRERYEVTVPMERVFVTIGSSSAFLMALIAAFDVGDRVALIEPCYPAYRNMLQALGLEVVLLEGTMENRFQPDVDMLEALNKPIEGLVISSPSNPAGTILHADELKKLAEYCEAKGIRILSDEIYHGITFGEEASTIAQFSQKHIVINSFSKYFRMPGWRLGWTIMPEDLVHSFQCLAQNFFISPGALAQGVALKAFDCKEDCEAVVAEYARNRAIMLEELPKAGFTSLCPAEGAFFIFANVENLTDDSAGFCRKMLQETGVSTVPGQDFDIHNGHKYVRFSYSGNEEETSEAMRRLRAWLGG